MRLRKIQKMHLQKILRLAVAVAQAYPAGSGSNYSGSSDDEDMKDNSSKDLKSLGMMTLWMVIM